MEYRYHDHAELPHGIDIVVSTQQMIASASRLGEDMERFFNSLGVRNHYTSPNNYDTIRAHLNYAYAGWLAGTVGERDTMWDIDAFVQHDNILRGLVSFKQQDHAMLFKLTFHGESP